MHGEMPGARQQELHLVVRPKALISRQLTSEALTRPEQGASIICRPSGRDGRLRYMLRTLRNFRE